MEDEEQIMTVFTVGKETWRKLFTVGSVGELINSVKVNPGSVRKKCSTITVSFKRCNHDWPAGNARGKGPYSPENIKRQRCCPFHQESYLQYVTKRHKVFFLNMLVFESNLLVICCLF